MRGFGSDNNSGVHPAVMQALIDANQGHVPGYGDDPYTARAVADFRALFGQDAEVFLVFNGTAANVTGLSAALEPYQAVICAESAHINVDECGAPEKFSGGKLLDLPTPDGKLAVSQLAAPLHVLGDVHSSQPRIVSITQPTELGTLYSLDEIRAIAEFVHAHGLLLHMDGARISNAAAALAVPVRAFTRDAGVDILSFGGTKNGMMYGEAVLLFPSAHLTPGAARRFEFLRKQGMQLASKMRFIAAQFSALLAGDLWLDNARQANAMARRLGAAVQGIPGAALAQPVQANAVFAKLPPAVIQAMQERYFFYAHDGGTVARWMASFDTTAEDVDALIAYLYDLM